MQKENRMDAYLKLLEQAKDNETSMQEIITEVQSWISSSIITVN